jgi:hypothetical protein
MSFSFLVSCEKFCVHFSSLPYLLHITTFSFSMIRFRGEYKLCNSPLFSCCILITLPFSLGFTHTSHQSVLQHRTHVIRSDRNRKCATELLKLYFSLYILIHETLVENGDVKYCELKVSNVNSFQTLVVVTTGLFQIAARSVMREYRNIMGAFNVQDLHERTCFVYPNFFL